MFFHRRRVSHFSVHIIFVSGLCHSVYVYGMVSSETLYQEILCIEVECYVGWGNRQLTIGSTCEILFHGSQRNVIRFIGESCQATWASATEQQFFQSSCSRSWSISQTTEALVVSVMPPTLWLLSSYGADIYSAPSVKVVIITLRRFLCLAVWRWVTIRRMKFNYASKCNLNLLCWFRQILFL